MRLLLFTDSASDPSPLSPEARSIPVYVGAAPSIQRESLPMIGRECGALVPFRSETGRLVEFWKSSRWAARPVPPDVPSIQNGGLLTLFSF